MAAALPGNRIPHSWLRTGVWAPACPQAGATQAFSCLPASTIHSAPTESLPGDTAPLPQPGIPHPRPAHPSQFRAPACPSLSLLVPRAHPHGDGDVHCGAQTWLAVVIHHHCHHHLSTLIFQGLTVQRLLAVHLTCVCIDGKVVAEQSLQDLEAQFTVEAARLVVVDGLKRSAFETGLSGTLGTVPPL